ncbi:uncharacterized protein LOC118438888 [Folsomia candida]|nr:uncharacterized protein LOC118438888 [Folsomia candida]
MQSWGHKHVQLAFGEYPKSQLLSEYQIFSNQQSHFVTTLGIDWVLNVKTRWSHEFFRILQSFPHVTSLQLNALIHLKDPVPYHHLDDNDAVDFTDEWLSSLVPTDFYLPKVTRLVINVHEFFSMAWLGETIENFLSVTVKRTLPRIFPHFQNLTHFGGINLQWKESDVENHGNLLPASVTSLSIEDIPCRGQGNRFVPLNFVPGCITRLQFHTICHQHEENRTIENVLIKVAPTLTHLEFSRIEVCEPFRVRTIICPPLPKLKVFKISRNPYQGKGASPNYADYRVEINFEFASAQNHHVLSYAEQFPCLEIIIVQNDWSHVRPRDFEVIPNGSSFETLVEFLYHNFMPEGVSPCETVRRVDIPYPAGLKFRWCGANCKWEWRDTEEFYDRVASTFPNLGYQILDPVWREKRRKGLRNIVEMARNYGFSEEDIHVMMRNGDVRVK